MDILRQKRFGFLGAGIIAGVFIERLLSAKAAAPERIVATDPRQERLQELARRFGIGVGQDNKKAARFGDILFVAVPPKQVRPVLAEVREALRDDQVIVSLAAAIPTRLIESVLERPLPVVRVIPNIPSLIGQGMNPHCLGRFVSPEAIELVSELLDTLGHTIRVEETQMNVATALTAVGPTYFFPIIKALQDAAVERGLSDDQARFATAWTALGAAQLVLATGKDPDTLKSMIGTRTLDEDAARELMAGALDKAFQKISEAERKLAG